MASYDLIRKDFLRSTLPPFFHARMEKFSAKTTFFFIMASFDLMGQERFLFYNPLVDQIRIDSLRVNNFS
jgi:hypothetical protein